MKTLIYFIKEIVLLYINKTGVAQESNSFFILENGDIIFVFIT